MKKLIFVNRYFYPDLSATSQILTDLIRDISFDEYKIFTITSRQLYIDPLSRLPKEESLQDTTIIRVPSTSFGRNNILLRLVDYLSFYLSILVVLLRFCKKGDVIIFKTDPPLLSVFALLLSKVKKITYINWLQDLFPEIAEATLSSKNHFLYSLLKKVRDKSLQKAYCNVVLGKRMQNALLNRGISQSKITIIPNWSDGQSIFPIPSNQNPLIKEWALEGKLVVAYSGNIGRAHDIETILNCAKSLSAYKDIIFLFIGGGNKIDEINKFITNNHINNISLLPYQDRDKLAFSLGVADIHLVSLLPELEGYIVPSKVYGIMAAAKPIINIGDPDGEIATLVKNHSCGLNFSPGEFQKMAQQIYNLRNNTALINSMGANARITFEKYFDKSICINKWKTLLSKLLSEQSLD